jgi:hypothetical protein
MQMQESPGLISFDTANAAVYVHIHIGIGLKAVDHIEQDPTLANQNSTRD